MVKLFIGNLPREATEQEIRSLFEQYGKVLECDIIKNYGFVHIEDKTAAEDAIRNLHHHKLHGVCINVEASKNKSKASTKLHVGNISPACTNLELRAKFEEYGPVIECDIVKDYAFVHMERAEDAVEAIRGLDNTEFQGPAASDGALTPPHRLHPPFLYGASPNPPPAPLWGLTASLPEDGIPPRPHLPPPWGAHSPPSLPSPIFQQNKGFHRLLCLPVLWGGGSVIPQCWDPPLYPAEGWGGHTQGDTPQPRS
ncbi:RNA-binding protein 4B-like isoform X3 [Buteo buteo]|uniref:RNA-binding protein 4B-like isoform X3 n=1 Tax=Buteo buteo TaxID=30397 RepID=UPI003EBD035E